MKSLTCSLLWLAIGSPMSAAVVFTYRDVHSAIGFIGHDPGSGGRDYTSVDMDSNGTPEFYFRAGPSERNLTIEVVGLTRILHSGFTGAPAVLYNAISGEYRENPETGAFECVADCTSPIIGAEPQLRLRDNLYWSNAPSMWMMSGGASGSPDFLNGPWLGKRGFLGIEFQIDGLPHYGWLDVYGSQLGYGGVAYSSAYESTPGQYLNVGTVPEPSTALLLGIVAACRITRRRGLN